MKELEISDRWHRMRALFFLNLKVEGVHGAELDATIDDLTFSSSAVEVEPLEYIPQLHRREGARHFRFDGIKF
jgi:hypothetical protein